MDLLRQPTTAALPPLPNASGVTRALLSNLASGHMLLHGGPWPPKTIIDVLPNGPTRHPQQVT